ncbi:MAG: metallophosphoesterase [Albidovulum sp.]|nr:metallophosphoesterase [Albidovulum sp.]
MADIGLYDSEWMPLDTGLDIGVRICAIGDVHGHAAQMRALISRFEREPPAEAAETKIIFLGDLIDRGPESLDAIDAAIECRGGAFASARSLMGNHEQMLKLALRGADDSKIDLWLSNGGDSLVEGIYADEFRYFNEPRTFLSALRDLLGTRRIEFLETLHSHAFEGNLLFVHAGIDPYRPLDNHLSQPWDLLSDFHWAWIREPFLSQPVLQPRLNVVHGHTFVRTRKPELVASQLFGPHFENEGKINLDAGSFLSGCVAGAEFERGRYRITLAVRQ